MSEFENKKLPIILASSSETRLKLLKRINIIPDKIIASNIDESEKDKELPRNLAIRLAGEKALTIANMNEAAIIIAADTVVAMGRRILPKALTKEEVIFCLKLLSGKRHRVYTGVSVLLKENDKIINRKKLVTSIVKFKRLTAQEINFYAQTDEGINKAGGYSIFGFAESFVQFISGSYSNVMGLPLCETVNMLSSIGKNITSESKN